MKCVRLTKEDLRDQAKLVRGLANLQKQRYFERFAPELADTKCAGVGMPDWLYQGVTDEIAARRSFFADQGGQQELYADAWKFIAGR